MTIVSKQITQRIAFMAFRVLAWGVAGVLIWILGFLLVKGASVLSWEFLTTSPTEGMTSGGIFPAIIGTLILIVGSLLFAFPLGVMAAIYLNEYARSKWFVKFSRAMTNNLGGVPSIVFGLFGMSLFVNTLGFGDSIVAGSLTLGLLVLPIIIRNTEEALKRVPDSYRIGSMALGASKFQGLVRVTLPSAFPNMMSGFILAMGRVSGETAPILFTVAAYFLPKLPHGIFDQLMALPYHLYVLATSGVDIEKSRPMAYGTALVLIVIVLILNILASLVRRFFSKK